MRAGEALERHILTRQRDPIGQDVIVRKLFEQMVVDLADVVAIIGQRNPAERPNGAGEQRAQISFREDLDIEGVRHPPFQGLGADQIAVVEHDGTGALESQHGADVAHDGGAAFLHQCPWIVLPHPSHVFEAAAGRNIAINQIMRGGLIGHHIRDDAALEQRLKDIGGISLKADRRRAPLASRSIDHRHRGIDRLCWSKPLAILHDRSDRSRRTG